MSEVMRTVTIYTTAAKPNNVFVLTIPENDAKALMGSIEAVISALPKGATLEVKAKDGDILIHNAHIISAENRRAS